MRRGGSASLSAEHLAAQNAQADAQARDLHVVLGVPKRQPLRRKVGAQQSEDAAVAGRVSGRVRKLTGGREGTLVGTLPHYRRSAAQPSSSHHSPAILLLRRAHAQATRSVSERAEQLFEQARRQRVRIVHRDDDGEERG